MQGMNKMDTEAKFWEGEERWFTGVEKIMILDWS